MNLRNWLGAPVEGSGGEGGAFSFIHLWTDCGNSELWKQAWASQWPPREWTWWWRGGGETQEAQGVGRAREADADGDGKDIGRSAPNGRGSEVVLGWTAGFLLGAGDWVRLCLAS